jgi:adenylate kinase
MDFQNSLHQQEIEKYLQQNQVYQLFEDLLKNLIIDKPEDPLTYLADKILEPDCNCFKNRQLDIYCWTPRQQC